MSEILFHKKGQAFMKNPTPPSRIPNAETVEAIRAIESGEDVGKIYDSMADFWAELEEEEKNTQTP